MTDRRTLKRQYLEAPSRAGVIAIRHRASGRLMVDGAPNAQAALNRHVFELRMTVHRNAQLQRDWQEAGEGGFDLQVLDLVRVRDEPGFDPQAELRTLVDLWREELGASAGYASACSMSAASSSGLVCGA